VIDSQTANQLKLPIENFFSDGEFVWFWNWDERTREIIFAQK
jgi:hypothetical protein